MEKPVESGQSARANRRARVLEESTKILNSLGISHASLPEIAKRLDVSRAALYYYFEDQQDLAFQCYRRSCELMAQRLNEAARNRTDPLAIIDAFIDALLGARQPEFAALSETAYLHPEQRSTILGLYAAIMANIADILKKGIDAGSLRPCSRHIVAEVIIGLISWLPMSRRWRTNDALTRKELVEGTKLLLRDGVAADRAASIDYRPMVLSSGAMLSQSVFDDRAMAAARREALLTAASWLFNLKGVDATSLDEIAARVGVTKKVVYHNVGDKAALVAQCYTRSFGFYEEIARRTVAYEGPRIDALSASTHALSEASLREDVAPLAPLAGFEALPSTIRKRMQASSGRLMADYLRVFEAGYREKSIRRVNARAVLAMHPGVFQWLPKWFDTIGQSDRSLVPREIATLVRIGLRPV
ncbi:MAG: TetR/AcrR family transcriptional regulator [Rhizomicrobium sp.]